MIIVIDYICSVIAPCLEIGQNMNLSIGKVLKLWMENKFEVQYMLVYKSILCISQYVFEDQKLHHFKYYLCISRL